MTIKILRKPLENNPKTRTDKSFIPEEFVVLHQLTLNSKILIMIIIATSYLIKLEQ